MNYASVVEGFKERAPALARLARTLLWLVKGTIPDAITRLANAKVEQLKAESEAFRRSLRTEQNRIGAQIEAEIRVDRTYAAGVARYNVEPLIAPLAAELRAYINARRRDVTIAFPNALDHFKPGDMVALELLRETLRPQIDSASIDDLTARYDRAFTRKDARGLIEAELIEARLDRGGVARTPDEVAAVKALADIVDGQREMRIGEPGTLRQVEEAIDAAQKAVNLADVARVRPVNPDIEPTAKAAHAAAAQEFEAEAVDR
jgi:hypothetical protein